MKLKVMSAVVAALLGAQAFAADGDNDGWTLRVGAAAVLPQDSSGPVLGSDGVNVASGTALGVSFEFPLSEKWGFEILAATPFAHDIDGTGALEGLPIGEVEHLPPTFSALYYLDDERMFHFGIGLNYTTFLEADASPELRAALDPSTELDLSDSFGVSLKFGVDIPVTDNWNFNANLYWMNIKTDADVIIGGNVAQTVDVTIDPFVVMLGASTTFD
ncbi:MAG: OmpW family outer membrane protein [Kangiellaceae bacterium]|nr:OmpW family outer membrane protein [Kangiellaceae bacterium]